MIEFDLTRILFAFFCGYFLTLSGTLTQTVANNSLASPSTLGFDGLAALCVILAQNALILFKLSIPLEFLSMGCFATLFGILGLKILGAKGATPRFFSLDISFLILLGLAFNLFVGAIFSVLQFLFMAMNYEFPSGLWFGNFRFYHSEALAPFIGIFILTQFALGKFARSLRLLSLGEGIALGFGVNIKRTQYFCLFSSLLMTGLVISFFGVFSFLSLIIPHMLRSLEFFKRSLKNELYIGAPIGGIVLAVLDWFCFQFDYLGAELPVGMVSSVTGAFLLIALLWKSHAKSNVKFRVKSNIA